MALVVSPAGANLSPLQPDGDKETLLDLAKRDPLALARQGYERYKQNIQDYRCTLLQARVCQWQAPAVEEVEVRFSQVAAFDLHALCRVTPVKPSVPSI